MTPFTMDEVQLIRAFLKAKKATRDLAILETGVDTMLRCGDLLRLKVKDVREPSGVMRQIVPVRQDKTDRVVRTTLTDKAHTALSAVVSEEGKTHDDYLFTRGGAPHGKHMSEVMLREIVKGWAKLINADPTKYGGHSLRRTKAVYVYKKTRNIEAVRKMLGHTSLAHTMQYLGVGDEEVADLALQFVI